MGHEGHDHLHNHEHADHIHDEHGHVIGDSAHKHGGHVHTHVHDPNEKKRQLNRISRVIGHLEHVKKMIENDEDCTEVLNQIAANKSALTGLAKQIINAQVMHCIAHAVEDGDASAIEELQKAIQKYID